MGKSTTCENLGIGLAMEGKKVLLVDTDPQGSLTISMGWQQPDELPTTLSTLMQKAMNDMTDLCNTVILVAGGKTCYAILFCIHTHGAELQNLELLAILGQANLPVEGGTTIGLDRNGRDQEQRA